MLLYKISILLNYPLHLKIPFQPALNISTKLLYICFREHPLEPVGMQYVDKVTFNNPVLPWSKKLNNWDVILSPWKWEDFAVKSFFHRISITLCITIHFYDFKRWKIYDSYFLDKNTKSPHNPEEFMSVTTRTTSQIFRHLNSARENNVPSSNLIISFISITLWY